MSLPSSEDEMPRMPESLNRRLTLEFHRWTGTPEGVTGGLTIYSAAFTDPRRDAARLQRLCEEIAFHLGASLPEAAGTLLMAGRLYRRAADYPKSCEYFLKALALVHGSLNQEQGRCA